LSFLLNKCPKRGIILIRKSSDEVEGENMKKYLVNIKEVIGKTEEIEAETPEAALEEVIRQYKRSDIILTSDDDLLGVDMNVMDQNYNLLISEEAVHDIYCL
jgi:molybdopterin converting factor small subunit